jgi:TonB family protein
MIGAWMLYCTATALLLGAAASTSERILGSWGRPSRFLWLGAIVGSGLLPIVALAFPRSPGGSGDTPIGIGPITVVVEEAATIPSGWRLSLAWADPILLRLWIAVSGALFAYLLISAGALAVRRTGWRREIVDGESVLWSRDVGPCVVGLFRPKVVLPGWVREAGTRERHLVFEHEREHVRTRDPLLLALGGAVLVAMPWNVALWWQMRGLRLAIETDCDRRVLTRHPDRRAYGALLLEVGRRRAVPASFALVAFAEPKSFLERRIEAMTRKLEERNGIRSLALAGLAALCLAVACEAPAPQDVTDPGGTQEEVAGARTAVTGSEPAGANGGEPAPAVEEARPPIVEEAPSGGQGPPPVGWRGALPPPPETAPAANLSAQPSFTPYTVALQREYPALLRDAGIGGRTLLWFFINEQGVVDNVQVNQGSGHAPLDAAALRVARTFEFTPALDRDERVPVWIAIPITFQTTSP